MKGFNYYSFPQKYMMEEPRISQKVVKCIVDGKAPEFDYLAFNPRGSYTLLEGNPFGYKTGIVMTGRAMQKAISKTVVNFLVLHGRKVSDEFELDHWIRSIVHTQLKKTFVNGFNGQKRDSVYIETEYGVESSRSVVLFSNFFFDEETKEIYSYE